MQLPDDLKEDAKHRRAPPETKYISLCSVVAGALHGFMIARQQPVLLEHRLLLSAGPIALEGIAGALGYGFSSMLVGAISEKFEREGRSMLPMTKMAVGGLYGGIWGGIMMGVGFVSGYSLGAFSNLF
jgi:hypothetical protein